MTDHVTTWLEAYHDGELQGRRLRQVEAHLACCETCCQELQRLEGLTALLQSGPAPAGLMSADRFVHAVGLRLPRRPERPAWQRALKVGWQLMPLGLLGAWAFAQTALVVTGMLLVARRLGLGGDLIASLLPASRGVPWSDELLSLSGAGLSDVVPTAWRILGSGGPLGWGVTLTLAALAVIGLLYWSWLASWWVGRQRLNAEVR